MRVLLAVLVVSGCGPARLPGAPVVGASCTTEKPECLTAESLAICASGSWHEWGCVGRCSNEQAPKCIKEAPSKTGDACPPDAPDGGAIACIPADGGVSNSVLSCIQGRAQAVDCARCTEHDFGTFTGISCN